MSLDRPGFWSLSLEEHCERVYLPSPTYPIKYLTQFIFEASFLIGLYHSLSLLTTFLVHCLLILIILQNRGFDATYNQSCSYYLLASLGLTSIIFTVLNTKIFYVFVFCLSPISRMRVPHTYELLFDSFSDISGP